MIGIESGEGAARELIEVASVLRDLRGKRVVDKAGTECREHWCRQRLNVEVVTACGQATDDFSELLRLRHGGHLNRCDLTGISTSSPGADLVFIQERDPVARSS